MGQISTASAWSPGAGRAAVYTHSVELFNAELPFVLESEKPLHPVWVAYETYGTLNRDGTNAILVCHALTGSAHAAGTSSEGVKGWWDGLIGQGRAVDTDRYFVVCSNFLGSCYGTTGPSSVNPTTGKRYEWDFPQMTVRDMVRLQRALLGQLGIRKVVSVIGGSLGGMQALEWAVSYPRLVESAILIATASRHSAWGIAWNEVARKAILNGFAQVTEGNHAEDGLSLARMIAMISYRSPESFEKRFGRRTSLSKAPATSVSRGDTSGPLFEVESYLEYQGKKLVDRFDPITYTYITRAMDLHDVGRNRGGIESALGGIIARTLCVGIASDVLYPAEEQKVLATLIPGARYAELNSPHGHDAFLIDVEALGELVNGFLEGADVVVS